MMFDTYPLAGVTRTWNQYPDLTGVWQSRPGNWLSNDCLLIFHRSALMGSIDAALVLSKYGLGWIFIDNESDPIEKLL